jgi:serine/threonine-protein kinase
MNPEKLLGQQLGPYQIEALLGSGGMAVVYRARRTDNGRTVALKVLSPALGIGAEIRARFEREARTAARLRHPGIVRVLETGQVDEYAYMAMVYVEGQTLANRLTGGPPLDEATAADIAWQIADALYYAHSQGVVHRDVKPSNILLTDDGRALLSDFGVAQALDDPALTRTGHTVGTPAYMAPEQASGNQAVDGRADLYALGVVLYQMVTGRPPFQGSTPQILHAHVYNPPPPPSTVAAVSPGMEGVIMQALSKEVSQRFQTGAAMAQALADLSNQTATHPQLPYYIKQETSKKQFSHWGWSIIFIIVALFAVWQLTNFGSEPPITTVTPSPTPTSTETPLIALRLTATPTPSPQPTDTSTASPTLTPTPSPTPTLTPTTAPEESSAAEPSPTPSPTTLPAPLPTPTFTATPCPVAPAAEYVDFLGDSILNELLGCPRTEAITVTAAWQPFEQGRLLWRKDLNLIYVLKPDHTWLSTGDRWREGDPDSDPAIVPPNGLYQPVRGFGQVWRELPGVRESLGWATAEEDGFEAVMQDFLGGLAWLDAEHKALFVLLNDGTYEIRP